MNNKLSITYLILIIISLLFSCRGPVNEENKNNASVSSIFGGHAGNDKYVIIDTKKSFVTWKGAMQIGSNSHTGYVYISKGELMIENGQLMGGRLLQY